MSQPTGVIKDKAHLEQLLMPAWDDLAGSGDGGMQSYKLKNRVEKPTWNPPVLSFQIERHGATVNSSIYAELQLWEIDCEKATASYDQYSSRRRQLYPKAPALKLWPVAHEIAESIRKGAADKRLKWLSPTAAKLLISEILPDSAAETRAGRRKRLYAILLQELAVEGWEKRPGAPIFERKPIEPEDAN
jgi:hypothetical protein